MEYHISLLPVLAQVTINNGMFVSASPVRQCRLTTNRAEPQPR